MRLGEAMVKEGLITNDQLAKALERQIIFGGRLGTNLVEMGVVSEETLARFLAKVLGVPYAEPERFKDVPQEVLDSLPPELAAKYTAFPIQRDKGRLHLAMKDPNDIAAMDELRFIVGMDIKPYISSEIRILYALEKHYGIKRDLRYISILDEEKSWDSAPAPKEVAAPIEEPLPEPDTEAAEGQPQPAPAVMPPALAAGPARTPVKPAAAPPARPAPAIPVSPSNPYEALASPVDREHVAEAMVAAAHRELTRVALFMVKGGVLTGWKAMGRGLTGQAMDEVRVVLDSSTVFKDVVEEKVFYKGPILQAPQTAQLMAALGGAFPLEAIAYPLIIKGKVVGVLYGDNGGGAMITGNLERLASLMAKASMSLEILILKSKILADS